MYGCMEVSTHAYLKGYPVFELVGEVVVGMERPQRAKLGILQQQHGSGSHTHAHQGNDVGVLQLG